MAGVSNAQSTKNNMKEYHELQDELSWENYSSKKNQKKRAKAEGKDKKEISKDEKREIRFEEKLEKWRKEEDK